MLDQELADRIVAVFVSDPEAVPPMTLRGGDAVDSYDVAPPYDAELDALTDAYLEQYASFALPHLDPVSWLYHLPFLLVYALRHATADASIPSGSVVDGLLFTLRPPDREPPRLAMLSDQQEAVIKAFLDVLAFDERSAYQEDAMQVMEEYWLPDALYRKGL